MMSFFKKLVHAAPDTNAGAGLLKGNEDAHTAPSDPPTDELFSTVGDYGLQTLSENPDNIVE
jgi:hypothetical protein